MMLFHCWKSWGSWGNYYFMSEIWNR